MTAGGGAESTTTGSAPPVRRCGPRGTCCSEVPQQHKLKQTPVNPITDNVRIGRLDQPKVFKEQLGQPLFKEQELKDREHQEGPKGQTRAG
ncbi:MAG: hypothetical protein RJA70_66 [Pseudomonadota bacterium]